MNKLIEHDLDDYILSHTRQEMLEQILVDFYGWIVL